MSTFSKFMKLFSMAGGVRSNVNPLTGVIKNNNSDGSQYNTPKQSDSEIDYIAYGLTLPTSGTIGIASISAGVAYVSGFRIPHAGSVLALEATKDNYIDIDYDGNIVVSAVAVAAGAPAKASNSLRLGYVTTNATAVTGAKIDAKDSNGNWMGNYVSKPYCRLLTTPNDAFGAGVNARTFGSATTKYDNLNMHDEVTNTSRITIQKSGLYEVVGLVTAGSGASSQQLTAAIYKNGSSASIGTGNADPSKTLTIRCGGLIELKAGDYVDLRFNFGTGGIIAAAVLSAAKVN